MAQINAQHRIEEKETLQKISQDDTWGHTESHGHSSCSLFRASHPALSCHQTYRVLYF